MFEFISWLMRAMFIFLFSVFVKSKLSKLFRLFSLAVTIVLWDLFQVLTQLTVWSPSRQLCCNIALYKFNKIELNVFLWSWNSNGVVEQEMVQSDGAKAEGA